jgi:hypothetical protein
MRWKTDIAEIIAELDWYKIVKVYHEIGYTYGIYSLLTKTPL